MKTTILFFLLLFASLSQAKDRYTITRYEQKSDALFVCINHTKKPVYIEHFFTAEERKDTIAITQTIERLVAELFIKADEYVEPEKFVSQLDKAKLFINKSDTARIAQYKRDILLKRQAVRDSLANVHAKDSIAPSVIPN